MSLKSRYSTPYPLSRRRRSLRRERACRQHSPALLRARRAAGGRRLGHGRQRAHLAQCDVGGAADGRARVRLRWWWWWGLSQYVPEVMIVYSLSVPARGRRIGPGAMRVCSRFRRLGVRSGASRCGSVGVFAVMVSASGVAVHVVVFCRGSELPVSVCICGRVIGPPAAE